MKRKPLSRTQWTLIAAIAAGVMVLAAVSSLAVMSKRGGVLPERYAVVYAKGSQNLCVALPEGVFPLRAQQSKRQWFGGDECLVDHQARGCDRDVAALAQPYALADLDLIIFVE